MSRKAKPITQAYREILDSQEVRLELVTGDGEVRKIEIRSQNKLSYGVAAAVIINALKGDIASVKELTDRVQGKAEQSVNLSGAVATHVWNDNTEDPEDFLSRALSEKQ